MSPAERSEHVAEDQLIDLVSGLMTSAQQAPLLAHIEGCPACERQFHQWSTHQEKLRSGQLPQRSSAGTWMLPRDLGPAAGPNSPSSPRWRTQRNLWRVAGFAAAVVLVALLWPQQQPDRFDLRLPVDGRLLVHRSDDTSASSTLASRALAAYRAGDDARVIEILGSSPLPKELHYLNLYLASAQLFRGQPQTARQTIEKLNIDTLPPPLEAQARWVHFVALERSGAHAAAHSELETLSRLDAEGEAELAARARAELARQPP